MFVDVKSVLRRFGYLLLFEALLLCICVVVALWYAEGDAVYFFYSAFITLCVSISLLAIGRDSGRHRAFRRQEAYIVVGCTWLAYTLFGLLPFLLGGYIPSFTDAFFETMSGFTTTGASILDNIESLPHGILLWRSLTQWIGGLGIIFFITILFVSSSSSGSNSLLFFSESTGVFHEHLYPTVRLIARRIGCVYLLLTGIEIALLWFGGMSLFDAVCHAFATAATGGFSTKQDSIAYFHSAYIEYVVAVFMLLFGISFPVYLAMLKGKWSSVVHNQELRWFLCSVGIMTLGITLSLFLSGRYPLELSFRKAFFQVATAHTSCGFASDDYMQWQPCTWVLLLMAMLSGGCTGSTSGGIKCQRLVITRAGIRNYLYRLIHPNAILPIRVDGVSLSMETYGGVLLFIICYVLCFCVGSGLLMCAGVPMLEAVSTCISALGNVGPALGQYGPAFSWAGLPDSATWVLSALMLLGRLEIFGFVAMFHLMGNGGFGHRGR